MKIYLLLLFIVFTSCARPLYIKDRHFNPTEKEYKMDTDLKELVYKSLERAFVKEKDIADYIFLWKKYRIYVSNEYQSSETNFKNNEDWNETVSYLKPNDVPDSIGDVMFSVKSRAELQKISNRTWEDFLHASFSLIRIDENMATVKINNTWIVSKHSKIVYLGGGGYTCIYKKIDGIWEFQKIASSWIS